MSLDSSIERIRGIQNKANTIVLLDGLDEDRYAIEDYNKRLKDILSETELFYKVIISGRTQFFPDSNSEPGHTDRIRFSVRKKGVDFIKYYISPFNEKEIYIYLSKKYNTIFKKDKIKRAQKVIENCPELMVRPMLLAYIDDLIDDKEKEYNYVYEIYNQLVYSWIEREAVNNETLYSFSEKIAEYMYSNKTVYIKVSEIQKICEEYAIQLSRFEAKSRSLLNRNANGFYKFAHKSILEFILANKAIKDTQFRKVIALNGFDGYDMLELFLREMSVSYVKELLKINTGKLENVFFNFLQLSEMDFSNIKMINCCFEGCNLSKADFKGVFFENTDFKGTNLFMANLNNSNMFGANLKGANLKGADLSGANLRFADLSGADIRDAMVSDLDLGKAILTNLIIDEKQARYLRKKYGLHGTKVYTFKNKETIRYNEFMLKENKFFYF